MKIIPAKLICKQCKQPKQEKDFYGRHKICKTCHNEKSAVRKKDKVDVLKMFIG